MERSQPIPDGAQARGGPQPIPRPEGATPGPPADWQHLPPDERIVTRTTVAEALATRGTGKRLGDLPVEAQNKQSAVLIPLYELDGELRMILTRRSSQMRHHQGEVAFPGGRKDPEDESLWDTATREAWEEVALPLGLATQMGELDSFVTVSSNSLVHPLVGFLPHLPELVASPAEVEHIIDVPVAELLLDEVYGSERWELFGQHRTLHFFHLHGDTIWGATAAMVHQFLSIVTGTDTSQ